MGVEYCDIGVVLVGFLILILLGAWMSVRRVRRVGFGHVLDYSFVLSCV